MELWLVKAGKITPVSEELFSVGNYGVKIIPLVVQQSSKK